MLLLIANMSLQHAFSKQKCAILLWQKPACHLVANQERQMPTYSTVVTQ